MVRFVSLGSELLVHDPFTGTDHYYASLAKKSDGVAFFVRWLLFICVFSCWFRQKSESETRQKCKKIKIRNLEHFHFRDLTFGQIGQFLAFFSQIF